MSQLTRESVLSTLQTEWKAYPKRFQSLPPEDQTAFLQRQGYLRLPDLLGHLIAWWEDGLRTILARWNDPSIGPQEYDVNAFNARAVARFASYPEAEVLVLFERTRQAWEGLVRLLPDAAFTEPRLAGRIQVEVIGHYEEHRLV